MIHNNLNIRIIGHKDLFLNEAIETSRQHSKSKNYIFEKNVTALTKLIHMTTRGPSCNMFTLYLNLACEASLDCKWCINNIRALIVHLLHNYLYIFNWIVLRQKNHKYTMYLSHVLLRVVDSRPTLGWPSWSRKHEHIRMQSGMQQKIRS